MLHCGDCIEIMKGMPDKSVELTLTDIPYGKVSRPSHGLRNLDKKDADIETFDLDTFLQHVIRICKGSIYIFCSTEQVSQIRQTLVDAGCSTRLCIWEKCLAGSTKVYCNTKTGNYVASIKDIARGDYLEPKLWDGNKWNKIVDIIENKNLKNIVEITLRSGEIIRCTENHKLLVNGVGVSANDLSLGNTLDKIALPDTYRKCTGYTKNVAWMLGLYLAEGSHDAGKARFSLNIDELPFFDKLNDLANDYAGTCYKHEDGNNLAVFLTGPLVSIIDHFILGNCAKNKHFASTIWDMDNEFLFDILNGYLAGDGGYEEVNKRWRLGFTRNKQLESDLRCLCARLGIDKLRLTNGMAKCNGKVYKTIQGNIRLKNSDHPNAKNYAEIIGLRKVKPHHAGKFWDVMLENEPHIFALASGVLSHNSNPSPMNGEYLWLSSIECCVYGKFKGAVFNERCKGAVWRYPTVRGKKHPTQKPLKLFEYLISVSSNPDDVVFDPCFGSGTTIQAAKNLGRKYIGIEINPDYFALT